jgi:arabinan endo-1,5-alpha-L-arabinosidase
MLEGGGKMVIAAHDRVVGPGHFGRWIEEEGVEKMSCHFEGDFDQEGMSVLGIRPLLWKNDWPVAGEAFKEGVYEIESERRGYALEMAVDFVRINQPRRWFRRDTTRTPEPVLMQTLQDVEKAWPKGDVPVRCGDYMVRPHQQWAITAAPNAGGYLGQPYYRISIAGTDRSLTATASREVIAQDGFTGADEQLWRIDQLTDGTFRIMPKKVPGCDKPLALVSVSDSNPTLAEFDFNSDNSKWNLRK